MIRNTTYKPPKLLFNGHLQTIYPALFRKVSISNNINRYRIDTPDDDFLDIDQWENGNDNVVIISHGLEGNSSRPYVLGLAKALYKNGFDIIAWNYRGCSDELNKQPVLYHSGATYDLETVVKYAQSIYKKIYLSGFSLGGNLTLKYLGEPDTTKEKIKKSIVFSTPLDLKSGSINLHKLENRIYERRFLKSLKKKVKSKRAQFPNLLDWSIIHSVKSIYEFDDQITSKLHGFENAEDYYKKCSSINFIGNISIPTKILNAHNDPLLTGKSLDSQIAKGNSHVILELTQSGGHCGYGNLKKEIYWSEKRALEFLSD